MAIDTMNIQVCLCKITIFSLQICFKFVSANPVFSSVSLFFILLYLFSPSFFAFIIYTLLILISAYGLYRVFYNGDDTSTDIVDTYKKNDGDPSNMGKNGSIADEVKNKNRKKYLQRRNIQDKNVVCFTRSDEDMVDKNTNVEENVKDVKEVEVNSVTDGAGCSPCKAGKPGISEFNVGLDEGSKINSYRKGSSETSEDSQEDRLANEQKSVTDEDSDIERNRILQNMIARRKARKLFSFQVRHTLMSRGNNDPAEHLASILVPRNNLLISNNELATPGSAPSVLLPMHNPFDIPYETHEERPNLTDESFRREFLAEHRDLMLCRHASFSWRALFSIDAIGDQDGLGSNDISFKPRAPQKLKISVPTSESHLENKDVGEVLEKESCHEKEAMSNGCSAEDHATQVGQAAQQGPDSVDIHRKEDKGRQPDEAVAENIGVPDSVDIHHKEDMGDTQPDEKVATNIDVGSSSSSSSEENFPVSRTHKEAILRSLLSFQKNAVLPKDDDLQVDGLTHDSDQTILNNTKSDDGILDAARVMNYHPRSHSLASDMLVEVSEISSPRSISSLDEEYSGNEEVKEVSSHPSRVDTIDESNLREVPEISDRQDISGGVLRINHKAASDVLAEKVFEENSINSSDSLSSLRTGIPDSTQTHSLNSNIEDLPDSSKKNNIGDITIHNVSDSKTPMNDDLEKSNTANKMDNGTPKQIIQPRDIPESSGGSNFYSVNHQDLFESSIQNQQNEKKEHFKDENGESEYQPTQNSLANNSTSVQSNHSLRSPENRRDEDVSEFEFPVSSAENEVSGVVSEIETEQVPPNISSSGSSPKSVLQPKFSSDNVSMDLNQGTSTAYQHPHNDIVDDDSVLPVVNLNHFADQNVSPTQDDSTSQTSHAIERLQSPRFADALFCVPFRSKPEERQNHDASTTTSASSFYQDIHDPYPHQSNFNKEAGTSNHIDNSDVNDNQERTNLESVENIEGDNHNESLTKKETAAGFMEPSDSFSSKSVEDKKEGNREIDIHEGAYGISKFTEGNSESGPDVKLKELQEAMGDDVANQTEFSNGTGNLVAHADTKEPMDLLERTMDEGNNSTVNQNDSVISKPDDSELKSVKGDIGQASEHVAKPEDVHTTSECDTTLDSKSTSDVEGGLTNHSES